MISNKYQSAFVHIPKTGGSSISAFLKNNSFKRLPQRMRVRGKAAIINENPTEWAQHSRAHDLRSEHQNFYCFAFVRNPWDLMVSSFFWWTQKTTWKPRRKYGKKLKHLGFKSFIQSQHSSCINECFHGNKGQSYWLSDKINFIGKFESLQQDIDTICDKIGISQRRLPHKNKSKHKHYTEYYNDETRQIVAEKYAKDIGCFGYKFGE